MPENKWSKMDAVLPSSLLNSLFLGDAKKYYQGPITMGVDGMLFGLPAKITLIKTL